MRELKRWDRLPGEPQLWYDRFETFFRPAGSGRSLLGALNAWRASVGKPPSPRSINQAWTKAATNWRWRERAEAWDQWLIDQRRAAEEEAILHMLERQREVGRVMQTIAMQKFQELMKHPAEMSAAEARLYFGDGVRVERESAGLPGKVDQVNVGQVDKRQMSLADFDWAAAVGLSRDQIESGPDDPALPAPDQAEDGE